LILRVLAHFWLRCHAAPMTRIVFVGAGSAEFTRQLLRDLLSYDDLPRLELVMHDIDPTRLRLAEQVARITVRHHGHTADTVDVRATADRREALAGADFVINTVNIGGHEATVTDFDVPESFGVRQTIADTLGVGGVFRALRTFPFLDDLAADMEAVCPDAWLLNYTNPMAMNIGYLTATHPSIKVLGLCHSVHWTVVDLCELVGAPFDEVTFRSAGVNHQAWVLDWRLGEEDLYPRLDAVISADPELRRRVRVDMYRRLGYYPTETSEHSSEYVAWYLHDDAEIARLRIPLRDYVGISAANVEETARLVEQAEAGEYVEPEEGDAEYAPQVIHSLVTGTRREIQANVANLGLIDNLPAGAPIEAPTLLDANGATPVPVGALPPQCAALNRAFLDVVDLTVRAAVEGRPDHVRHALMVDPNTAATLDVDRIWRLADAMVEAHRDRLPPALRSPLPLR
jgi:alpha-galactosidase